MTEWRAIVGFEGLYEISDCGRVRRPLDFVRYFRCKHKPGQEVPCSIDRDGYVRVSLYRPGDKGPAYVGQVHRLVARAFLGPNPDGLHVDHLDGDKSNNRVSNLELVTRRENSLRAARAGAFSKGRRKPGSRLSCVTRWAVARLDDFDWSAPDIAAALGICPMSVYRMRRLNRIAA